MPVVDTLVTKYQVLTIKFAPGVAFLVCEDAVSVNDHEIPSGAMAVFTDDEGAIHCMLAYIRDGVNGDFGKDEVREAVDEAVALGLVTVVENPVFEEEDAE
jgi:hypothetical protein